MKFQLFFYSNLFTTETKARKLDIRRNVHFEEEEDSPVLRRKSKVRFLAQPFLNSFVYVIGMAFGQDKPNVIVNTMYC